MKKINNAYQLYKERMRLFAEEQELKKAITKDWLKIKENINLISDNKHQTESRERVHWLSKAAGVAVSAITKRVFLGVQQKIEDTAERAIDRLTIGARPLSGKSK